MRLFNNIGNVLETVIPYINNTQEILSPSIILVILKVILFRFKTFED